jgi:hypothetical protein
MPPESLGSYHQTKQQSKRTNRQENDGNHVEIIMLTEVYYKEAPPKSV